MVDVKPLSQMDPRWKAIKLGNSSLTIGNYGCLLTCMTMIANYYGFDETPATVNEKMQKVQGFQEALIIPAAFPSALPGMLYRNFIQCRDQPAPLAEIDAYLAQGKPVIVEVDYSPNAGLQNHWIVLTEKRGSDYVLVDPYPYPCETKEITLLTSRYKFAGSASKIIQSVVFLDSNKVDQDTSPVVTLDKGIRASFSVISTADGLALRREPVIADHTLIKRVGLGAQLIALEDDAATRAKVGVLNQWLPVKDPADGTEGWAAAWYLKIEQDLDVLTNLRGPRPIPPPIDKPKILIVKTIAEGVALRSKPEIRDATLVKRVPVNTDLMCTEPFDAALAKVGVVYQWLKVQDVNQCEYYVAAWYVKAVNGQATLGVKNVDNNVHYGLEVQAPEPIVVRASVEGLALRTLPLISPDTLIERLAIDSELIVLEPPEIAEPKIGQIGEWFHIRNVEGVEGYVAAWYTIKRPEPIIDPSKPVLG